MSSTFLRKAREDLNRQNNPELTEKKKREKKPLSLLNSNLKGIVNYCKDYEQDWTFFIVGTEGSGKSTLASHVCNNLTAHTKIPFSLEESIIYSFDDRDGRGNPLINSMVGFIDKYKDTPFKILWYDEAVSVLFSDDHATKESKNAKKSFIIKRDMSHFDILVAPSFYHIVKDIRERRVKTLLYCFREKDPITRKFVHKYAFFSKKEIAALSSLTKGREIFGDPKTLFKRVPPKFVEEFPPMSSEQRGQYLTVKRDFRDDFFDDIIGNKKQAPEVILDNPDQFKNDMVQKFCLTQQEETAGDS